ncbi:uncharacterized protein BJ171DRAFT_566321, partial [Polychytrium aggregatum]|uniref:uncharacterized protein n=1 Tax=Polychytrium aggregatum TaxID=110093 RepID=UPI0022FEB107
MLLLCCVYGGALLLVACLSVSEAAPNAAVYSQPRFLGNSTVLLLGRFNLQQPTQFQSIQLNDQARAVLWQFQNQSGSSVAVWSDLNSTGSLGQTYFQSAAVESARSALRKASASMEASAPVLRGLPGSRASNVPLGSTAVGVSPARPALKIDPAAMAFMALANGLLDPIAMCGNGYCNSDGTCTCHVGWATPTSAPNSSACSTCADRHFLYQGDCVAAGALVVDPGAKSCVPNPQRTQCPSGEYYDGSNCRACGGLCDTCYEGDRCLQCSTSGMVNLPNSLRMYPSAGPRAQDCLGVIDDMWECNAPSQYVDLDKGTCEACPRFCASCGYTLGNQRSDFFEQRSLLQCSSCESGYLLD